MAVFPWSLESARRSLLLGVMAVGCHAASSSIGDPHTAAGAGESALAPAQPSADPPAEEGGAPAATEPSGDSGGQNASSAGQPVTADAARPGAAAATVDLDPEYARIEAELAGAAPAESLEGWSLTYRVRPDGLQVEFAGLRLRPRAKAVRQRAGGFGLELEVDVESVDGLDYRFLASSDGPLSVAGEIISKEGTLQRFAGTRRPGAGPVVVGPTTPGVFHVRWPLEGQPRAVTGQRVRLDVGLWGVATEGRSRPVRRLFRVEAVATPGAKPVVSPPPEEWGEPTPGAPQ